MLDDMVIEGLPNFLLDTDEMMMLLELVSIGIRTGVLLIPNGMYF